MKLNIIRKDPFIQLEKIVKLAELSEQIQYISIKKLEIKFYKKTNIEVVFLIKKYIKKCMSGV